ncbi:MAG: 4-(cytidine 5'-diphospho)-2-C-methyl-D-erythritol kinase [Candidatus Pseudobacter hemicellulosilyticus]|uniref:4-diphosphocytidyl-2-C-methyl-D-erythritol kinase n=1 Tax=Candidatus Pseudobacter hemicellulosilyticus TaxID=3121375 RepID=A0AAJ5WMY5_9BACT|nr:MAG: 4-(cytidine 5'-diphospho)-2-C-methyl-D-erythritol kinase [Pseudobacter sp.]
MVLFPNGKLNLGLQILRKRPDGYHDLRTVFFPVPVCDALELVHAPPPAFAEAPESPVQLYMTGIPIQGNPEDNLCVKAYQLLKKDFPQLPPVAIHLHKKIPAGAGLGGGSADGAFLLRLLNDKFRLGIDQEALISYALQLGSDCPFFILNTPCLAEGRGEHLQPIDLDLSGYQFLLVNPGVHVNTGWAFSQLSPAEPPVSMIDIIRLPVERWRGQLLNDFEEPVCRQHPALRQIPEKLYAAGAVYAAMTGSGSTFFGIFRKGVLPQLEWPEGYSVFASS